MISLAQIREWATALPEVEEVLHFKQPNFRVAEAGFLGLEKRGTSAIAAVDRPTAAAAVAEDRTAYQEVWRNERLFIGVRIDLARAPEDRVRELIEAAWRNKAPARLRGPE